MIEMPRMRIRRRDKRVWFMILGVFAMVFLFTFLVGYFKRSGAEVGAASLEGFDAGYIMSDYQMGRYDAMSEAEIQAFLTAKNPCNNTDYSLYQNMTAWYPNISWHFENGHFVCLSEELFGDGEVIGSGETAAHIIWQAAQDYRINPQVLIVLLQKEQGLITDTYPHSRQYRSAMGYGCPDTAPCAVEYYGFKNQVRKAASLFRTVLDGGWTNYPLGENYIQYNPSYECGGSVVNIRSLATSALYRYTPYQPNEGALAAGYGTAYCGAYGNRNFYLYFEDWFGGIKEERIIKSDISKYYIGLGDKRSDLGEAVTDEICGLSKKGCYQAFEDGYIYWKEDVGAHMIAGNIFERWFVSGTEWGILGYPIEDVKDLGNDVKMQKFENGYIYEIDGVGAWDVSGGILSVWEKDVNDYILGYPTSSELVSADGMVYQTFERGTIYWDVKTGGWVIANYVADKWEELGGFNSKLGKVLNKGYCGLANEGCYQAFQTGNIYWTEQTGAFDVSGGIYRVYLENGTEWGILGYPTSSELVSADGMVYQTFERGTIYWDVKTGGKVELR